MYIDHCILDTYTEIVHMEGSNQNFMVATADDKYNCNYVVLLIFP